MKNNNLRNSLNLVTLILLLVLAASSASAKNNKYDNDRTVSLVIKNLSAKLNRELAPQNVTLDVKDVETASFTHNEMILSGNASCLLKETATTLPITFEAKFNTSKQAVEEIKYTFLDSEYAPTTEEDFLTTHLLNQLSIDYKSQEVVIAIDNYELKEVIAGVKEYKGSADIRVGQLEWRKINFDVFMTENKTPVKVEYDFVK
ncbi:hypothetical protein BH10ACI1_BH10ACI1_34280 [soil metagenome]